MATFFHGTYYSSWLSFVFLPSCINTYWMFLLSAKNKINSLSFIWNNSCIHRPIIKSKINMAFISINISAITSLMSKFFVRLSNGFILSFSSLSSYSRMDCCLGPQMHTFISIIWIFYASLNKNFSLGLFSLHYPSMFLSL